MIVWRLLLAGLVLMLTGCHSSSPDTLVIGTIAGPETDLVEVAKQVAEKDYGLTVKIVEFNDYNLPNQALNDGSLDANVYQHQPYLNAANKAHHYQLKSFGKTFLYPVGLYSKRHANIQSLQDNAIIALPNDPSNEARALLLLQQHQLITLKNKTMPGIHDIISNPHHFQFKELDAALLPRVLSDVDAAIINTTFAIPAGLKPSKDALILEDKQSPYANIMVIRNDGDKKKQLAQFLLALHSKAVTAKAEELFGDAAIPAW